MRPDFSLTLDDFRRDESTRKRVTNSLQSGGTVVMDEFSSASDLVPHRDDDVDSKKDLPKLPSGNNRFCCLFGVCVFVCCCLTPVSLVGIAYLLAPGLVMQLVPMSLRADAAAAADNRAVTRDATIQDHAELGLWDSQQRATPLQMQVALSQALGVRVEDEDVRVTPQQNRHFFEIKIDHATQEEIVYMESQVFLASLNAYLAQFGACGVLTHSPRLLKTDVSKMTNTKRTGTGTATKK